MVLERDGLDFGNFRAPNFKFRPSLQPLELCEGLHPWVLRLKQIYILQSGRLWKGGLNNHHFLNFIPISYFLCIQFSFGCQV